MIAIAVSRQSSPATTLQAPQTTILKTTKHIAPPPTQNPPEKRKFSENNQARTPKSAVQPNQLVPRTSYLAPFTFTRKYMIMTI